MKPLKSVVFLTAGVLAFSACNMKKKSHQTNTAPATTNAHTDQGSGAVSNQAAAQDNNMSESEKFDEESTNSDLERQQDNSTNLGTGGTNDVDETSSKPNNVKGGRDPLMLPKNK